MRITIAALVGLEKAPTPEHADDPRWLYAHSDAATYALTKSDLPLGGWDGQGMWEATVAIEVESDDPRADSARNNSARAGTERRR